jgi:dGTPase
MDKKKFVSERIENDLPKYKEAIKRLDKLYNRPGEIRSDFARDYTRILHCFGFRRLKHKTQVFFAPYNDHICTRLEHALYVASISQTISKKLGLNTELVTSIAIGHDLGHAPFGHYGEKILNEIALDNHLENKKICKDYFWHEKHSLQVVDYFETVKDVKGYQQNLKLTYAVRDGIICHHGEGKFTKPIKPRNEPIDLSTISKPGEVSPFTWEGCIVKISDMISYLGRDLEDAEICGLVENGTLRILKDSINNNTKRFKIKDMCNSTIIHALITDLCNNSDPKTGLNFSEDGKELIAQVIEFNYEKIYNNKLLDPNKAYIKLVLGTIFDVLKKQYEGDINDCVKKMRKRDEIIYRVFLETWLERFHKKFNKPYHYLSSVYVRNKIKKPYDIKNEKEYCKAIIDYMAGFTDNFANRCFNEILPIV